MAIASSTYPADGASAAADDDGGDDNNNKNNNHILGYCSLSTFRSKPGYDRTVEISVYIHHAFRNKGVASALLAHMLQVRIPSLSPHPHVIVAGMCHENERSVLMFRDKFGFKYVGTFNQVGYKFGRWLDVHFYQKILSEIEMEGGREREGAIQNK